MVIHLTLEDYLALVRHARTVAPIEDCGLLGGIVEDGAKVVKKVFYLTNTDHSEEHFSLDPKEQFAAVKELRAQGWQLLGNWHSHPASPSRPSEEDKRLAFDRQASYFILSLAGGEPVLNSYHIDKDKIATKEDLHIGTY
ncbi:MAG: M67 family metallopeptidase [Selenomonas sp.]|jgi:proteasome lid subunit RPN8/RPN11|nr:M67 family metallopeptidase [Selenomonas sp.]MCI7331612.1 M67 family metallopeptidase [Selenomonadaceae bacterium]MDD6119019.1 M67 family metallopeptidase [Selenomonadaceae bacterium]MDD7055374.1 M67 family metallopeptidase [Selenomonadaceae bacterium]MDY3917188.1 M67 family metallopeptidase [Selenomonadaceae bacterium]